MISLSEFFELSMKTLTPMISDIEVGLNVSESYSREISKFINTTFTTYEFDFDNNDLYRSIRLYNEDNNRYVDVTILDSVNLLNSCKKIQVIEYIDDSVKFNTEYEFSTLNELKEVLKTITDDYRYEKTKIQKNN